MRPPVARLLPFLAALLACLTLAAAAHAQVVKKPPTPTPTVRESAKKVQDAAREAVDLTEAEALGQALVLLLEADRGAYGGHDGHAKAQILDAIKLLDGSVLKKGTPAQKALARAEESALAAAKKVAAHAPPMHETLEASDNQLRAAEKVLVQVGTALTRARQSRALGHVERAVKDIEAALAFPARVAAVVGQQLVEAEVLREAYVLLAEANHDYDGHRGAAAAQVKDALQLLDASVLRKGTPAEKAVTAAAEKMAKAVVTTRGKARKDVEAQQASDDQLRIARELLVRVDVALAESKQRRAVEHVRNAVEELSVALKVR